MTAGERIQEIIKRKGYNVKTLSEAMGYDRPQVLYDLIKGRTRNISASMCQKLCTAIPELNRIWVMTGEGPMLTTDTEKAQHADVQTVPLVPISAIAGPLTSYYESGINLDMCERIYSPNKYADLAISVTGDSMEPMFADGSVLYIKRINEAAFIPWGHPLVVDTENGVFIKNIMPDETNEQYIWAESINPRYPRMHIPKTSIAGMYRVLSASKTFVTM